MKKKTKKLLCIALAVVMTVCMMPLSVFAESTVDVKTAYEKTAEYMNGLGTPGFGTSFGEWTILGLARSGKLDAAKADGYYKNVETAVKEKINSDEQLDKNKSSENSRAIIGLTAIGKDVTNVAGHNLLKGLTDMTYVTRQGINGAIYALIAFDTNDYEIPQCAEGKTQVSRETLINFILNKKIATGGWALGSKKADPDITAMAIQSLAPYYDENSDVKAAVDQALDALSNMQMDTGGYASWGTVNVESTSQVIVALTSLGIDPTKDERFIKKGNTLLDAIIEFYVDGGGFEHTVNGGINGMATDQVYYALVSYYRLLDGKTVLYDMTDVFKADPPQITEGADVKWENKDGAGDLTFRSDASIDDFIMVTIDGEELSRDNYTLTEGSTVVTIKASYLSTLESGEHTIGIVSTNGTATAKFAIEAATPGTNEPPKTEDDKTPPPETEDDKTSPIETDTPPKTGDSVNLAPWLALLAVMAAGTAFAAYKRKED